MNYLNTNVILNKDNNNINNNEQITNKIKSLLLKNRNITPSYINNTTQTLKYIGEGINGTLYTIPKIETFVNDGKYYVVKVFKHTTKTLPQIKKELLILKKLESNAPVMEVINPCIDTILTKSYVITIFDSFNGMTLREFIKQCHRPELDNKARNTLLKYCFKQIFMALNRIHTLDICHLQLTPECILVKLNITPMNVKKKVINVKNTSINTNTNTNINTNINTNTTTNTNNIYDANNNVDENFNNKSDIKDKDLKNINKDFIYPVNSKIYKSYIGNENPVVIKFTNFGLGCGKLPKLSISDINNNLDNLNIKNNVLEKCNLTKLPLLDPYMLNLKTNISNISNNKNLIKLGKQYDFFNIGIIGLMCIVNKDFFSKVFDDVNNTNLLEHLKTIKYWNKFLDECKGNIVEGDNFNIYFDNIYKYCLGDINTRKDSRYIQNNIILLEKHKDL